jgi:hypothetical protein
MGQLTASIAHEVNQPIAAVVINAQAALRWLNMQPRSVEVRQALDRIVSNATRGRRHRPDSSTRHWRCRARISWTSTIREVIALTRNELHRTGTLLQTQLADGLPLVPGNRIELQQVMLNLILNAVEAMSGSEEGSRELLISTEDDARTARIAVRDWPGTGRKADRSSTHSTRPSPVAGRDCRSAVRSSRHMADACGLRTTYPGEPSFNSPCLRRRRLRRRKALAKRLHEPIHHRRPVGRSTAPRALLRLTAM